MATAHDLSKNTSEPILGVVIIARNEEKLIARCMHSVLEALQDFPNAPVILIDSDSSDRTVEIASAFPVSIYRYQADPLTAGAGRTIGFGRIQARYVLFVDGDCAIDKFWPSIAIQTMEKSPNTAAIYGSRREIAKEGIDKPDNGQLDITAYEYEEDGLGGNAMYRTEVLRMVGGFNPFLLGQEESELLGRILAKGYRISKTPQIMYYHYTIRRDTPKDILRRLRRGHFFGSGQALRLAFSQGRISFQARVLNRYLIMQCYLLLGIGAMIGAVAVANVVPVFLWLMIGAVSFGILAVRRHSLVSASHIASEWFVGAIMVLIGFLPSLKDVSTFSPKIEKVK